MYFTLFIFKKYNSFIDWIFNNKLHEYYPLIKKKGSPG